MADPNLTLAAQYLRHAVDVLRSTGVDVARWLELHGMNEAQLEDASLTLTLPMFRQLLVDGMAVAREPALGLFVGERLLPRTHGFVGYAAMNSATMREVLDVNERFLSTRISVLSLSYEVDGEEVRVVLNELAPLGDIRRPVLEAVVMAVKNVLESVSMGACQVRRVAFPFDAPDYADLAREIVGCPVAWSQAWVGMTIPTEVLDLELRMADPAAFEEAAQICQRELDELEANETLSGRVRRLLLEKQNGFPSLAATARMLHVTPRTLHRRLKAEGTSYRGLLEDVRYRLAADHLRSGRSSVEEIAYMLGYSDPANFRRAFKRWAEIPPSAFRDRERR